ncbi:unnamed protein product [Hymenolepis diminuta]|uniref:HTH La-type RNA-binding domain-containing protein n=1 Tax=Hymenolepis diminuta TaxID=6216 RepID=A0A0R3SII5_HYMDI|nr:unnamed protein product [Hymenolepis diminuta]VUZ39056.1 unnamed protein product [Hymenolepis diminuta]
MNHDSISKDFENLNISSDTGPNGVSEGTEPPKKQNVWKGRSGATGHNSTTETKPDDCAGESEAWPVPSANRVNTPVTTNSATERPRKRNNVKWVTADLPFGRGGPRNSQASSSATDHGANSFRGGRGFGRRGSNNGPMSTRGQGRNLNGDFRRPRQTNDDNANNSVENATTVAPTTTSSNQENGPKPVSVSAAAALSTANARGSYQPRVRRSGVNRGAPAINRFSQPIPNPPIGVDGLVGANINASLTTIHPSGHMSLFFHNPPVPLPPNLSQSVLLRPREPVILDNGIQPAMQHINNGGLYVNTASANVNVQSAPSVQSQPSPSRPVLSLEEFMEIVKSNIDVVIAPQTFKNNENVKELLHPLELPGGAINANFKIDEALIYIGEEIYLSLNSTFSKIMKFHNRLDFINHHINHYFSEKNLQGDKFLYTLIKEKKGICPFSHLLEFKRLKVVNTEIADLIQCATPENNVEVIYDEANAPMAYQLLIPLPTEVSFDIASTDAVSRPQSTMDIPNYPNNGTQPDLEPLPLNYPYHSYVPNVVPAQAIPATFSTGAVFMDPSASGLNYHPESLENSAYSGYMWGQNYLPPPPVPFMSGIPSAPANGFPQARFSFLPHLQYPANVAPSPFVYIPSPYTAIGPRPTILNTGVVRSSVVPGTHPSMTENPLQDGNPDSNQ